MSERDSYNAHIYPRADRLKLESPLEQLFIEQFEKFLTGKVDIIPQYEVQTNAGRFRLDFLIETGSQKIAIECDGKEFHDEWRDEWRDALILANKQVDVIYRFRGKDIFESIYDCIHVLYFYDPQIFNDRYSQIYQQLISADLTQQLESNGFCTGETKNISLKHFDQEGEHDGWRQLIVIRRDQNEKSYGRGLYEFSKVHPGLNIDQLIEERKRIWRG